MELAGTKYRFVLLALATLTVPGVVTASPASHDTDFAWQPSSYAPDRFAPLSRAEQTSGQRAAAIHACNARARRLGAERDWQFASSAVYGACMFEHHQRFG
jgi:hypothetical protein